MHELGKADVTLHPAVQSSTEMNSGVLGNKQAKMSQTPQKALVKYI